MVSIHIFYGYNTYYNRVVYCTYNNSNAPYMVLLYNIIYHYIIMLCIICIIYFVYENSEKKKPPTKFYKVKTLLQLIVQFYDYLFIMILNKAKK
jgi:hypothetical protein